MKKALIITYYWPPSGGSGVQRWVKFVKYLREFGWEPIVLTVDPEHATFPILDESLLKSLPDDVMVVTTKARNPLRWYKKIRKKEVPHSGFAGDQSNGLIEKTIRFIRGNFFIPDARKGWNVHAFKAAENLIRTHKIDVVITSSPPHSTQLIGLKLKRKLGVKWVADLRDPWTEIYYNDMLHRTAIARKMDERLEKQCVETADRVLVVSDDMARSFLRKYPAIRQPLYVLPNGYDTADFVPTNHSETNNTLTFSYIGSIGQQYPYPFLLHTFKELRSRSQVPFRIRFVGNINSGVHRFVQENGMEDYVEFTGYLPHEEAVQLMCDTDILVLIIPEMENNKGILTGKIFEYLATGNPILAIGPSDGDLASLLERTQAGTICDNGNKQLLQAQLEALLKGQYPERNEAAIARFSRRGLTEELAQILEDVIKDGD